MKPFLLVVFSVLLCSSDTYALKPKKDYWAMPDAVSFPGWKALTIETADHYKLAAWRLQPKGADRHINIIIAGGDAGNMSNWLPLAFALTSHGFTVLTFDYRGFGGSDAFPIDTAQLYYNEFDEDLKAVMRWSRMQMPRNKIALYGFSMGNIIAARCWKDVPADYFIAEALIVDPVVAQQRLFALKGKMFGLPADAPFHAEKVANLPGRMLAFEGEQDPVSKLQDCMPLMAAHPQILLKTFAGGHGGGFSAMMDNEKDGAYVAAIIDFTLK